LRHWLLQTPGEEIAKKRKKDDPSLAIGEKFMDVFTYRLNRKKSDK
jgi:hypothetical protein